MTPPGGAGGGVTVGGAGGGVTVGGAGGGVTVMPPGGAGGGSTVTTPPGGDRGRVHREDGQREQPSRWQRLESNVPVALTVARGSNESAHGGLSPMVCAVVR